MHAAADCVRGLYFFEKYTSAWMLPMPAGTTCGE